MKTLKKSSLFWDVSEINPRENAGFVIERILNYGDEEDVRWALKFYGTEAIKKVLIKMKAIDDKSLAFWCQYFNIDPLKCIQKQSTTRQSAFWKR